MAQHQAAWTRRRLTAGPPVVAAVVALCLLAWATLLLWQPPAGHSLSPQSPGFIAAWLVMVVAMMLPTALPLLLSFQRESGGRAGVAWLSAALMLGYLLSWALPGVAIAAGGLLLGRLLDGSAVPGALALVVAGCYQLTPLKRRALEACRAPQGCPTPPGGRAVGGARHALLAGLHHGRCCVACCWGLMLPMVAAGAHSPGLMAGLAVVMAAEKWLPWGRRLSLPLGVALLIWGAILLGGGAPPAPHMHHR